MNSKPYRYEYSKERGAEVRKLAAFGYSQQWVADLFDMSKLSFMKYYGEDFRAGRVEAKGKVKRKLFELLESGDSKVAIHLDKTLCKAVEGSQPEHRSNLDIEDFNRLDRILAAYERQKVTLEEAARKLDRAGLELPQGLRSMLAKTEIVPVDKDADVFADLSEEELAELAAKRREAVAEQSGEWLDGRKEEVAELKAGMAEHDSFKPAE